MLRAVWLCILCGVLSQGCAAFAQVATVAVNWPRATYQESLAPNGVYSWTYQPTNIADTNVWYFVMDNNITTNGMDYSANIPRGLENPCWLTYQFATSVGGTNIARWQGRLLYDRAALFASAPIGKLTGQPALTITISTNK